MFKHGQMAYNRRHKLELSRQRTTETEREQKKLLLKSVTWASIDVNGDLRLPKDRRFDVLALNLPFCTMSSVFQHMHSYRTLERKESRLGIRRKISVGVRYAPLNCIIDVVSKVVR